MEEWTVRRLLFVALPDGQRYPSPRTTSFLINKLIVMAARTPTKHENISPARRSPSEIVS
jgi:hypothetical protein